MVGGASDMKTQDDAIAGRYPLVFVTPEKVIGLHSFRFQPIGSTVMLVLYISISSRKVLVYSRLGSWYISLSSGSRKRWCLGGYVCRA